MESRRSVRVDSIAGCAWTEFRRAAAENRIASSLSLNLYSHQTGAFAGCEAAAAAFASAAARLLYATGPRRRT